MAYNHGKEERKWRLWKEAEEKILRAYGVDENIIEEIRIYDRAEFNSDRRFYRRLNDMEEYIEKVADNGLNTEIKTVSALLDEVENELLDKKVAYGLADSILENNCRDYPIQKILRFWINKFLS